MTQETPNVRLSGLEKASLLLVTLGTKTATGILQELPPEDVQRIAAQIARQGDVDPETRDQVIKEFDEQRKSISVGGIEYAKELLEEVLGASKAQEIIDEINAGSAGRPFDWLKSAGVAKLASYLENERPQVIALVLAHLTPGQAAEALTLLPEAVQGEVAYKLTSMQPVVPDVIRSIEETLRSKILREGSGDMKSVGGVHSLVSILNNSDRPTENKIIEFLAEAEAQLADSVRQMMFVFEDIAKLDERAIQLIIREAEQEDLRLSMKGAPSEIRDIIFKNMSERAAETLKEDLENMGPAKRRDVEAAQRRVVAVVRKLDESGEISLRADEEEYIT